MITNYKFHCDCGRNHETKDVYLKIEYFGSLGKPLENVTFTIKDGNEENCSDIDCTKIPQLIQNLQEIYNKYQKAKVKEESFQKQGKLESLSQKSNLPNLREQNSPNKD